MPFRPFAVIGSAILLAFIPSATLLAGPDPSPTPPAQKTIPSFWSQQYMLGDWGGTRTRLADQGFVFDFNDIGDFQADVMGSQTHHATYFGRLRASMDIDFRKAANFDGELFVSAIWQYGPNLSGKYLNVNTLTSSIAGEDSLRLDQFWYQHSFANDMFKVKIGQIAAVNEFGATDFFDILFNDELGYAPNALFGAKQPFSPAGKPGIVLWGDLSDITPGLYTKAGVFTAYANPYNPDAHGFNYGDDFNHGAVGSYEIGYIEQKTPYNGSYKMGVNFNGLAVYTNPATGQNLSGNFTAYGIAQKTVYHPVGLDGKLDTKKGLDLLLEFVGAPGDRNSLQFEVTSGARYTGLIPGRDEDKVGFGVIYSNNGGAYSQAYQNANGRSLGGETTVELDYQYNPTPWLSIQPDTQFIVEPGGDGTRSPIVVMGLRTILRF